MNNFKRLISVLLSAAAILTFSSCGKKEAENITTEPVSVEEPTIATSEKTAVSDDEKKNETEDNDKTAEPQEESDSTTKNISEDWKAAFTSFLNTYKNTASDEARYSFHYFDDDDVPELFISEHISAGAKVIIYKFDNGAVTELGRFGTYGVAGFAERNGIVYETNTRKGHSIMKVSEIKDGKTSEIWSGDAISSAFTESGKDEYKSFDKNVSKDEYEADLAKYVKTTILTNRKNEDSEAFPTLKFETDGEEKPFTAEIVIPE